MYKRCMYLVGTYSRLVALGNQPIVILSVDLQDWGLFGIKAGLSSGERRQDTDCQGAEGRVMHGEIWIGVVALCLLGDRVSGVGV